MSASDAGDGTGFPGDAQRLLAELGLTEDDLHDTASSVVHLLRDENTGALAVRTKDAAMLALCLAGIRAALGPSPRMWQRPPELSGLSLQDAGILMLVLTAHRRAAQDNSPEGET